MKARRVLATLLGIVAMLWAQGSFAWAGPQWCEEDPEFVVNGALVDVSTLFPGSYAQYVSGSVNFNMQVPSNVTAAVVSLPGTVPVTAQISRTLPAYYGIGSIPVVVTVSMNSSVAFQTTTTITGLGGSVLNVAYGSSTWPTKAKFYMYGL
jgi:hypothetical protein